MELNELVEALEEAIKLNYSKTESSAKQIVLCILKSNLSNALIDSSIMTFTSFSRKYNVGKDAFEYKDFTSSEVKTIISETPLTERDRKIATLRFIEMKSEDDIAYTLGIDKKTVHYNLPKISILLKETCFKLYS